MRTLLNPYRFAITAAPMIDTTGLTLWFKGYAGMLIGGIPPADGGTIDQLENQIGVTDALQTTAGARPTWHDNVINGKGIVRFDGIDDFLSVANGVDTDLLYPLTFFFLINIPAFTSHTMLLSKGTSGAVSQYSTYINPPIFPGRIFYCADTCQAVDGLTAALWERLIVRADTGTALLKFYRNGVEVGSGSIPTQSSAVAAALIGKRVDGLFNPFDMVELGMFNRNLSDTEITNLDLYMAGVVGA
jgi:hypothetical protein